MAHANRVLRSINDQGATRCVDLFLRPGGTIGFEEYRRDVEDGRGWFPVGGHSPRVFHDEGVALEAAMREIPWLRQAAGAE